MTKNRDFDPLDPFPSGAMDAVYEFISTLATANFKVRIKPGDATRLQVPAGPDNDQVAVGISGRLRYVSASIERGGVIGGARSLDVWLTATDNVFEAGDPGENDLTDYAFALAITETGVDPVGAVLKRKVATAAWGGAAFTVVDMLIGAGSAALRHAATHAAGAPDALTPAAIGAATAAALAAEIADRAAAVAAISPPGDSFQAGVVSRPLDLVVSRPDFQTSRVAGGAAWIPGPTGALARHVQVGNVDQIIPLNADPNPVIDTIFAVYAGPNQPPAITRVRGVPNAAAQVTTPQNAGFRAGAPAAPANSIPLKDIVVPGGSDPNTAGTDQDRRTSARGYSLRNVTQDGVTTALAVVGGAAIAAATPIQMKLTPAALSATAVVRVRCQMNLKMDVLGVVTIELWVNGAKLPATQTGVAAKRIPIAAANTYQSVDLEWLWLPLALAAPQAPGKATIELALGSSATGTISIARTAADGPFSLVLDEDVRYLNGN